MGAYRIQGGQPLVGRVRISGSKNAALPLLAACVLVKGPVRLRNLAHVEDVRTMIGLLRSLGAEIRYHGNSCVVDCSDLSGQHAAYAWVSRMRAGICLLGPLLARFGKARVALPGGCSIGDRPIDVHLRAMESLGADIRLDHGDIVGEASPLIGKEVCLAGSSGSTVTGSCNAIMAAIGARGTTILRDVALEPEVRVLTEFLRACGADVEPADGGATLRVTNTVPLLSGEFTIPPDRIEAGTLLIAAAATRGCVELEQVPVADLNAVFGLLRAMGVVCEINAEVVRVKAKGPLSTTDVITQAWPGIPTDLQAPLTALLCTISGAAVVSDQIFPERFAYVAELKRLGACLRRHAAGVTVDGGHPLTGTVVEAPDLRAAAALVIAGLAAAGTTTVEGIEHLERGYDRLDEKLRSLGAVVQRTG